MSGGGKGMMIQRWDQTISYCFLCYYLSLISLVDNLIWVGFCFPCLWHLCDPCFLATRLEIRMHMRSIYPRQLSDLTKKNIASVVYFVSLKVVCRSSTKALQKLLQQYEFKIPTPYCKEIWTTYKNELQFN